ncbi:MAG: transcriptional repressor [bacterium]|nr:transcriptional repressor [bacterium]
MTENQGLYKEFLLKHNLKSTKQRRLIFNIFLDTNDHMTAEEFRSLVRDNDSSIGQATVYRMLKLMTDSGIARKLEVGGGITKYEQDMGKERHDHLICEECYKYIEFHDQRIEELQMKLAENNGFVLTGHKMFLYGICRECREKKNKKD